MLVIAGFVVEVLSPVVTEIKLPTSFAILPELGRTMDLVVMGIVVDVS